MAAHHSPAGICIRGSHQAGPGPPPLQPHLPPTPWGSDKNAAWDVQEEQPVGVGRPWMSRYLNTSRCQAHKRAKSLMP